MNVHADYGYSSAAPAWDDSYLWHPLRQIIAARDWPDKRAFDLGSGNGVICHALSELGFQTTGVDTSASGVEVAQRAFPNCRFAIGSAYDDLSTAYGTFPLVVSLEVIEHCVDPRAFAKTFMSLIEPGGVGVLSTPYHGYLKNLALAVTGRMDAHFTALWDGGHIKFFSIATLRTLLTDAGATDIRFVRAGRIPALAKSMIAIVSV